jgi:hypothetical protein
MRVEERALRASRDPRARLETRPPQASFGSNGVSTNSGICRSVFAW